MDKNKLYNENYKENNLKNKENLKEENNEQLQYLDELVDREGTTKYGEFVTSYFAWLGPTRQKSRADQLNEMTKNK